MFNANTRATGLDLMYLQQMKDLKVHLAVFFVRKQDVVGRTFRLMDKN